MHNQILQLLLDRHRQKYAQSCSPSLIEIMLKHYKLVPDDYYELQDKYKNKNVGLIHFAGQEIEGLKIESHDPTNGQSFNERLLEEWGKNRLIGLYCVTPQSNPPSCHGWIVSTIEGDNIFLLSKYSEQGNDEGFRTAQLHATLTGTNSLKITDIIFGTPVEKNDA